MVLSRPSPFEEIMAQQIQVRPQVRVDDVPEWFANQYALMRERMGDMQRLARDISGTQPTPEQQLQLDHIRGQYEILSTYVNTMLDTQQMQGNMHAMFAHHNFGVMSGAINQLGSQVWMTIAALQTSQDERDLAYETARLRTVNSQQVMN